MAKDARKAVGNTGKLFCWRLPRSSHESGEESIFAEKSRNTTLSVNRKKNAVANQPRISTNHAEHNGRWANSVPKPFPLSPSGPVFLNMTFRADSTDPRASASFTVIPIVMDPEDGAPHPKFRDMQPWDLARPIPLNKVLPIIYDVSTQKYWLFTIEGAVLLHETPRVVITKKTARQLMAKMPAVSNANHVLVNLLNMPASSSHRLGDSMIIHHALHDSITVKRSNSTSSFLRFWEDKVIRPASGIVNIYSAYLLHLRPAFDGLASHKCTSIYHCGNNVLYCSSCTAYRLPKSVSDGTVETGPPLLVGRLTVPARIAESIYGRFWRPDSQHFDADRAYKVLSECFYRSTITAIDIPPAWLVANLLRDSLFVPLGYGNQRLSWANHFKIGEAQVAPVIGANSTINTVAKGTALTGAGLTATGAIVSLLGP